MTYALWGALLGLTSSIGVLMVAARVTMIRRPQLSVRVVPYVRELIDEPRPLFADVPAAAGGIGAVRGVFGPVLSGAADWVERLIGGSASVRRRLQRADLDLTVHEFRVSQVHWGLIGFAVVASWGLLRAVSEPSTALSSAIASACAFIGGVLLRDNHLGTQVKNRERRILTEFPTLAEMLALAVAAGESPVTALDRVVTRSRGELSRDLSRVLATVRTGRPVGEAFDELARTSGLPLVSRFAHGVAVAVERGTPLADVLHAQAADVREAGRRDLIEAAARREVAMMVPVVFLVLPVTVVFAFWPGLIGLSLTTP